MILSAVLVSSQNSQRVSRSLIQLWTWRPHLHAKGPSTCSVVWPLCDSRRKLPAQGPKTPDPLLTTIWLNKTQGQENRSVIWEGALTVMRSTNLTAGVRWRNECSKIHFFPPSNTLKSGVITKPWERYLCESAKLLKIHTVLTQARLCTFKIYGIFWKNIFHYFSD